jgi:hypothetical protein
VGDYVAEDAPLHFDLLPAYLNIMCGSICMSMYVMIDVEQAQSVPAEKTDLRRFSDGRWLCFIS